MQISCNCSGERFLRGSLFKGGAGGGRGDIKRKKSEEEECLKDLDVRGGRVERGRRIPEEMVISDDEPDNFSAPWSASCAELGRNGGGGGRGEGFFF